MSEPTFEECIAKPHDLNSLLAETISKVVGLSITFLLIIGYIISDYIGSTATKDWITTTIFFIPVLLLIPQSWYKNKMFFVVLGVLALIIALSFVLRSETGYHFSTMAFTFIIITKFFNRKKIGK
jgi:hypothetical protein